MTVRLLTARARSINVVELTFSGPIQILPLGVLPMTVFTVEADGGYRRVSQVALEGDRVLILTLPGRALSVLGSLTVSYQPLDLAVGVGYLAELNSSPISSLNATITTLTTTATLTKPLGLGYRNLLLLGDRPINGIGNNDVNMIVGNSASNLLDGREGADQLIGGKGDDIYIVDRVDDEIVELIDEGVDLVKSTVSCILPDNVERITLSGWDSLSALGNNLNNIIYGNNGSNVLDGGLGEDLLVGGKGNDFYYVNSTGDRIVENGLESDHDVVFASTSWVLGSKLEELRLQSSQAIDGVGNERNNLIFGNNSANVLDGGLGGVDQLTGLGGADVFRFTTRPVKMTKPYADHIIDFTVSEGDTIALRKAAFNMSSNSQVSLASANGDDSVMAASASSTLFVYDRLDGTLFWNENGVASGFGAGGAIAILDSIPELSAAVIKLI